MRGVKLDIRHFESVGCAMNKQAISKSLLQVILITSLVSAACGQATATPGVAATPEIATLVSINFNQPAPAMTPATAPATAPATVPGALVATDGVAVIVTPAASQAVAATNTAAGSSGSKATATAMKTALATVTFTAVPNSRSNPVAAGMSVQTDNLEITVSGIIRPADSIVTSGNALNFNNAAGTGKEYLFVKVSITCEKPADQQCILNTYDFKAIGADGVLIKSETTIAGVDNLIKSVPFYGGSVVSGSIPFIVTQGDASVEMVYQTVLGETLYMALPGQ